MTVMNRKPQESLQDSLQQVTRLLERHKLVEGMVHKQDGAKQEPHQIG